jgi:dimethylglycine dehydrogenase
MKTHAQAVVIGGGVIGSSILYHLAKAGWSDVVLLERSELTSGSTWHAAANIHGLHDSTNISRLQHYTMNLYKELEAETGQSCGVFQPGSLYLAQTEDREHQLRLQEAKARRYGMNFYEVTRDEAERLHPLVDFDGIRCIMYEPDGGNADREGRYPHAMGDQRRRSLGARGGRDGRACAAADPDRAPVFRDRDHSRDRCHGPAAAVCR